MREKCGTYGFDGILDGAELKVEMRVFSGG